MDTTITRTHAFFTGRVQGVYFRYNTRNKAEELGLAGWVRNLPDGRVEAIFEGPASTINAMIVWCRTAIPRAKVISVVQTREEPEGLRGFDILR